MSKREWHSRLVNPVGLVGVLGLALLLPACSSAPLHVVVDPSLADAEVYAVSGHSNRHWGQPLQFGEFTTKRTRVGSTWAWTTGAFDWSGGVRTQPYRFIFVGESGEEWQVECRARTPILRHADKNSSLELAVGETRLGCAMRDAAEGLHSLELAGNGLDFAGETELGGERIEIRALSQIPDRTGRPRRIPGVLGYELRQGDRVLGSVDLLGKGQVYLARDLPATLRTPVAMTATVLMFFGEA